MGLCSSEIINLVAWQSRTCVHVMPVVSVLVLRIALGWEAEGEIFEMSVVCRDAVGQQERCDKAIENEKHQLRELCLSVLV